MWIIPSVRYNIRKGEGYIKHYHNEPGSGCLQIGYLQFDYYGLTLPRVLIVIVAVALIAKFV